MDVSDEILFVCLREQQGGPAILHDHRPSNIDRIHGRHPYCPSGIYSKILPGDVAAHPASP